MCSGWLRDVSSLECCVLISWEFPHRLQVEAEISGEEGSLVERRVPGGHFPLQNLPREAEGATTPCMQMQGTLHAKAWRSGKHTGQGVKKSVSSKSGRLDRDD